MPTIFDSTYKTWDYDMAGDLFEHVLTNLQEDPIESLEEADLEYTSNGVWRRFDQQEFTDTGLFEFNGLAKWGYVFIPNACLTESCKVHLHTHGCQSINQGLFKNSQFTLGFAQYASSNNLILLYPQAEFNWIKGSINPCFASGAEPGVWNDEEDYLTNQGV